MRVFIAVSVVFVAIIAIVLGVVNSSYNTAINYEADIKAAHEDSGNILASGVNNLIETSKVPGKYTDDLKEILKAEMGEQGRYGADGKQAMMNWLKERNLDFDASLYKQIQISAKAKNEDFKAAQTKKLAMIQDYEKYYKSLWPGGFVRVLGFPSDDYAKYTVVVKNDYTQKALETGKAEAVEF
jgi:hypothetical protein